MLTSLRSNALAVTLSLSMPEAVGQSLRGHCGGAHIPFYSAASGEETSLQSIITNLMPKPSICVFAIAFGAEVLSSTYIWDRMTLDGAVILNPNGRSRCCDVGFKLHCASVECLRAPPLMALFNTSGRPNFSGSLSIITSTAVIGRAFR